MAITRPAGHRFRGYFVRLTAVLLFAMGTSGSGMAASVNLGLISFDTLIPGDAGPGVNVFNIQNLTGGVFALPPDFPAVEPLTFTNSVLTLSNGGSFQVIQLGDITPGVLSPTTLVEFPETDLFSSAVFTATLSETTFLLSEGGSFTAASPFITAEILPSSSTTLSAGLDFAVISVSDVPEPGSMSLLVAGLCVASILGRRRSRRRLSAPSRSRPRLGADLVARED